MQLLADASAVDIAVLFTEASVALDVANAKAALVKAATSAAPKTPSAPMPSPHGRGRCAICMSSLSTGEVQALACMHLFHERCLHMQARANAVPLELLRCAVCRQTAADMESLLPPPAPVSQRPALRRAQPLQIAPAHASAAGPKAPIAALPKHALPTPRSPPAHVLMQMFEDSINDMHCAYAMAF
jgi:hypothetical protein